MNHKAENTQHRGEILKKAADESGMTVEIIVERMHYSSRNTFYNHTRRADLSLAILRRYGKVLGHNFSADIPEMVAVRMEDPEASYLPYPQTTEEAIRQRDFYLKKYMFQLEEFRKVLDELNDLKEKTNRGS